MKADKDFEPMPQRVSVPWYITVPLWFLAFGSWFAAVWIQELTTTIRQISGP
jgi:hypothetical protein